MAPIDDVNIESPAFKADPYPFFARLRAEAPVHRVALPAKQTAWLVTRYDDVVSVLKDERFVKDRLNALTPAQVAKQPWIPGVFKPLIRNMLDIDPPDHTRLRSLVHSAFTSRRVENLRPRVQALTEELLDAVQGQGRMDLIRDYALPVPTTIIAEMLGVPVKDRMKFHRWSSAIVAVGFSKWSRLIAIPNVVAFLTYLRKLIRARRAEPRDDLISALASAEEAGDMLTEDELAAMAFLLLVAGHETTVNLIGNGVLALMEHPESLEQLRDDPGLIKTAVEELLRFDSPLMSTTERYAREDLTVAGVKISRGEMVFAMVASANRDEAQFERADVLDLTREPNRHLAFGLGVHYCLGAPLARLEGQIAINALLRRMPDLRLAAPRSKLPWRRGLVLRGVQRLPVAFGCPRPSAGSLIGTA